MKLTFCGVRGSTPTSGAAFVRFGGNTSSVALTATGADLPSLIFDAGTGLQTMASMFNGRPFRGTIVLSHLHWDHVQAVPFFSPGDRDDAVVDVFLPAAEGVTAAETMTRFMRPPYFPIRPDELRGAWQFRSVGAHESGTVPVLDWHIRWTEVHHKGGRTCGYRVDDEGRSIAYVPDHALGTATHGERERALDLVHGVDVLIHDAQFVDGEQRIADAYGHSTVEHLLEFASTADVKKLVLFHHSPTRTDDQVETIGAAAASKAQMPVLIAREGTSLDI